MPQAAEGSRPSLEESLHIEEGVAYLIPGKHVDVSFRLFRALADEGVPGLCLTRLFPEKARSRYGLGGTTVYWLSQSPGDDCLNPTAIGTMAQIIDGFLEAHADRALILLDGVEYITNHIGFLKALYFVEHLNDSLTPRKAILLIPVDPACFEPSEFARLERFLESLDGDGIRSALENADLHHGPWQD